MLRVFLTIIAKGSLIKVVIQMLCAYKMIDTYYTAFQ